MKTMFSILSDCKKFLAVFISFLVLSSFSFSQIPTNGLQLWLKADAGFVSGRPIDTLTVSEWADQSGNGNNATQSNTDRQPLLVANGLNNKPVLRFDGFNDMLGLTGTQPMSQISLFMVYKVDSGATGPNPNFPLVLGDANLSGGAYGLTMQPAGFTPTTNTIALWTSSDNWLLASLTDIAKYGEWKILSVVTNQTILNTTVHANGEEAVIIPQGPDLGISFSLGNSSGPGYGGGIGGADGTPSPPSNKLIFKGDIAEVIVYDTVLSDEDRQAIEKYLNDKYNINNQITSIPSAGLQLWLKADAGVTLNGSNVSNWADQSGNGNNALQTNADRQPLFVSNEINNKPVLRFDGLNDMLGLTGTKTMSKISLFMVYKVDSGATGPNPNFPLVLGDANINGGAYGLTVQPTDFTPTPNTLAIWTSADNWLLASLTDIAKYRKWENLSIVTNQTILNTTVRTNWEDAVIIPQGPDLGISFSLGNSGGPGHGGGIGGADNTPSPPSNKLIFKGDIAEIIIYDTALDNSQRDSVEQYLSAKYNINNTTAVNDIKNVPVSFSLSQNYPNPFNPSTTINYSIPTSGFVTLKIYDVLGREVATLVNEEKPAGNYQMEFNASNLSSGIYFYKIQATPVGGQAGGFIQTKKMVLLK